MNLSSDPYGKQINQVSIVKQLDGVVDTSGRRIHKGDVITDEQGRRLTVVGFGCKTGKLMTVDADWHMVGVMADRVTVIESKQYIGL